MYEVRERPAPSAQCHSRGIVIAVYSTYREAFRRWQELNAAGRNVYVIHANN